MTGQERSGQGEGVSLVTGCGRRIAVKCLRLASPENPISRVTLNVGKERYGEPGTWASLTADEARGLAHLLLAEASRAERAGR
ncbi:hypothetical protein [Streptomyces sp. NPDC006012]|uniref:hypothetical protein n=1 Tax=Streptomyces sp. NPDC006012 TaxID=3364739 RepID=UPI00369E180E